MRIIPLIAAFGSAFALAAAGRAQDSLANCQLCETATPAEQLQDGPRVPVRVDIEANLDFSKVAARANGSGSVTVAPKGARSLSGTVTDLGGMGMSGIAHVRGAPNARLRIDLPRRVTLRSTTGAVAEIVDIQTDASAAPTLDTNGKMDFSFGGKLIIKGRVSGIFRGQIPISVEYE